MPRRSTKDFDDMVSLLQGDAFTQSARVIKDDSGAASMYAAHMILDGREYVCTLTPTDLLPPEDQS